jgi:hypothetical protein
MRAAGSAGAGFLLAVLWFDLMFDVQVAGGGGEPAAVDSIAAYYRRVTTAARPMNRLVALVMLATLAAIVAQVTGAGDVPRWAAISSLVLVALPIGVAGSRTVPRAVRLGAQSDDRDWQVWAARTILREHLFCLACIAALIALQLLA